MLLGAAHQVCREELFMAAARQYITAQLGPAFIDPPFPSLSEIYLSSSPYSPIIFLMAQGADAIAELVRYAAVEGRLVGKGLQVVSLGQGQGPVAEALVHVAMKSGDWVCLQVRCTAVTSWLVRTCCYVIVCMQRDSCIRLDTWLHRH